MDDRSLCGGQYQGAVVDTEIEGLVPALGFASNEFCILPPAFLIDGLVVEMTGEDISFEVSRPYRHAKVFWDGERIAVLTHRHEILILQLYDLLVLIHQIIERKTGWARSTSISITEAQNIWMRNI